MRICLFYHRLAYRKFSISVSMATPCRDSRGVWVGLKTMKDTVEVTSVVDGDPQRMSFVEPKMALPEGGLSIRLGDTPVAQEARMIDYKRFAAEAFARANRIDRRMHGKAGAKIGFVAAGKNWLDLVHAMQLLGDW